MALVPQILHLRGNKTIDSVLVVIFGIFLLSGLSQISISLSWTPVPVTGQTFGIALISLLWGKRRGVAVSLGYLIAGALGFPVFALGKSGMTFGPTSGYLFGMLIATYVMGALSDRMHRKSFFRLYGVAFIGSFIIFSCGLFVLSFFVSKEALLMAGMIPFLPGDFLKSVLASLIVSQCQKLKT